MSKGGTSTGDNKAWVVVACVIVGAVFCGTGIWLSFELWGTIKTLSTLSEKGGLIFLCVLPGIAFSLIGLCFFAIAKKTVLKDSRQNISQTLQTINVDVAAVKAEIGTVKTEVGTVKTEVGTVKTEVGTVKTEVAAVKAEIGTVKAEIATVKADAITKTDFATVKKQLQLNEVEANKLKLDIIEKINNPETRDRLYMLLVDSQLNLEAPSQNDLLDSD